ncbi:MAG TPA: hypothetical protein VM238_19365 [Phycisphaerae bacterium]|nr:hypothetical protein [Phycisphaerae bacterium]
MLAKHLRAIAHGLILVSAMLALIAVALWFRTGPLEPQALAKPTAISTDSTGIPDSGRQREAMVEQLRAMNDRLRAIEDGLSGGKYVIQTTEQKASGQTRSGGAQR